MQPIERVTLSNQNNEVLVRVWWEPFGHVPQTQVDGCAAAQSHHLGVGMRSRALVSS